MTREFIVATPCNDIETLLPAYLDGELAPLDRLSFEHHLADCSECHQQARAEAGYLERVRALMAPPPAPTGLETRVRQALDHQEHSWLAARRRQGWAWALPGGAGLAAAAALVVFALSQLGPGGAGRSTESPAVRQAVRDRFSELDLRGGSPQEISVAAEEYLRLPLSPPHFVSRGAQLKGWQPRELNGRLAAMLFYEVPGPHGQRHVVTVHVLNARDMDLRGTARRKVGSKVVWVARPLGVSTVSYKDPTGIGYVISSDMNLDRLVGLVVKSDLLYKLNEQLRGG